MNKINVHKGWLKLVEDHNYHETVELNEEPIAEVLDYLSDNVVTIRYYISDKEANEEELKEDFLINTLYGNLDSNYGAVYSEYTGYLWTNDELKVGGHDLLSELEGYVDKYLYLIVELDMKELEKKEIESKIKQYRFALDNLKRRGSDLGKNLNEIAEDLLK